MGLCACRVCGTLWCSRHYGGGGRRACTLVKISADMLVVNAAAVIAISAFAFATSSRLLLFAAAGLLLGTFLFCGELSAHAFLGRKFLPLAAPVGGFLMIAGWLACAAVAFCRLFRSG